jgi:hypothetical protein
MSTLFDTKQQTAGLVVAHEAQAKELFAEN